MGKTDALALHLVKMSDAFAEAYPDEAAEYRALFVQEQEIEAEEGESAKQWENRLGENVNVDDEVAFEDDVYVVLQAHTISAEWCPPDTPALYRKKQGGEWPEWVQPQSAADAYNKGDKVTFEGEHYISAIDGNVWSPSAYPQGWAKQ